MTEEIRTSSFFNVMEPLVLASASAVRKRLLEDAGVEVSAIPSNIDEAAIRETLLAGDNKIAPDDVAEILARAKGEEVAGRKMGSAVIAADQVLYFDDRIYEKPVDMDQARAHLLAFGGHMHTLHSAVILAVDGEAVWSHVEVARVWMRHVSPEFVGRYLARVGDRALSSVGCYELEGYGVHLIEKIEGDYFTVLGLPLLPLLGVLRRRKIIDG